MSLKGLGQRIKKGFSGKKLKGKLRRAYRNEPGTKRARTTYDAAAGAIRGDSRDRGEAAARLSTLNVPGSQYVG